MESALLLDVVILEAATVFKLLARKNEALLVGWNALLVLDLRLHVLDGISSLNLERDCLPCESLHEDLHTSPQPENQMDGGFFLDVVVRQSPAIFELFPPENQSLLVRRDALLVSDLILDTLH